MRFSLRTIGLLAVVAVASLWTAQAASAATTAWWKMDETSGTTMNDSVGSADGTLHNVTVGLAGISGKAYGFNGTSSYVSVPNRSSLNPGSAKVTVQIAVLFTTIPPQDYDLIRKGLASTAGGDYKIEIVHSGQALCLFGGSKNDVQLIGGPKLNDGRWHRISCLRDANKVSLSVDGVVRKSVTKPVGTIANTSSLYIGAKPGSDWHNGRLDDAKIIVG
jgi:concanavalin A-like lectin/glucanase superfamily protein